MNRKGISMTIKEIAELAQVSKGTVSKAINNQPGVSEKTRKRILKLIEELDYHPNSAAQALAFSKTTHVGLVIPHEASESLGGFYWSSLITGIAQAGAEVDYHLVIFTPKPDEDISAVYHSILRRRRIDGLIVGSELMDSRSINALINQDIPFVLVGRNPFLKHFYVDVDNKNGAKQMVKHMVKEGYRRIAFLGGPEEYYYMDQRGKGFTEAMLEEGLPGHMIRYSEYANESVDTNIEYLLKENPDAIFLGAGGDFVISALKALKKRGVDPHDFGLTVFDDYAYMDFMDPKMSAVSQPIDLLGRKAFELLYKLICKETPEKNGIELPTKVVVR